MTTEQAERIAMALEAIGRTFVARMLLKMAEVSGGYGDDGVGGGSDLVTEAEELLDRCTALTPP